MPSGRPLFRLTTSIGPDIFNLNLELFHEISKHSGSAEALKYARDWLTTCQSEHPDCCPVPKDDGDRSKLSQASIRILRICDEKLILESLELREDVPQYVALSHCWGSSLTLKTLSTNIESFRTGIQVRDLPSTFIDAVKMTRLLGFDYIWIDSLCIVQDNLTDWEEQSSLMASVYGNAELVIAASSASSTEDGFLKQRKGYRESSLRISCAQNKDNVLDLRYRLLTAKDLKPMVDPLDLRAWAFQERLLARRYLAIGAHDTSWTCTTALDCECEWWRIASIWRNEVPNIKRLLRETADEEMAHCWRENVLEHYAGRDLTVRSDNLVAISAIASIFRDKLGPGYYAGIWQQDIIPGLLWAAGDATRSPDHSTPSWSWASLPTLRFAPIGRPSGLSESKELAKVLEIKTTTSTVDPFGSVNSGFIKLWGQVWRAEILTSKPTIESPDVRVPVPDLLVDPLLKVKGYLENTFRLYFDMSLIMVDVCLADGAKERSMRRARGGEAQEDFYIGNLQEGETIHLLMVPLIKTEYQDRNDCKKVLIMGLILGRSCEQCTRYERVGRFRTFNLTAIGSQAHRENSADDLDEQEIVII